MSKTRYKKLGNMLEKAFFLIEKVVYEFNNEIDEESSSRKVSKKKGSTKKKK